jgi:AcrR family transcriptional regulator
MTKAGADSVNQDQAQRGRPRDATLDQRVRDAAIQVFAEFGWSGFGIEGVAKAAGVGKGSIYLRWASARELLLESLATNVRFFTDPDSGNLRKDLLSLAQQILKSYEGENGRAYLRANLEGGSIPGFEEYWAVQQDEMRLARKMLRRGVERGELPSDIRVTTLLAALSGGLLIHSLTAPAHVLRSRVAERRVCEELVDLVLGTLHGPRTVESPTGNK